ncbi:MAG: lipid-binding SYLF domain-containing protein [Campylobacteraceae bacterium]
MKTRILKLLLASFLFLNVAHANEEAVLNAANVFSIMMRQSTNSIPEDVLRNAKAIAIIPNSFRVGFIISGAGGNGVMSVKQDGVWSYPVFVSIGSGNIGLQAGIEKSNKLIVFLTSESVNKVINGGLKLGGDATVAAGPIGVSKDNIFTADVYTYAHGKGLFAGVALGGLSISLDDDNTKITYGFDAKEILSGKRPATQPYAVTRFLDVINRY